MDDCRWCSAYRNAAERLFGKKADVDTLTKEEDAACFNDANRATRMPPPDVLLRACAALGKLVAAEYPEGFTLARIAEMRYGDPVIGLTPEDMAAIRAVELVLPDEGPGPGDGPDQALPAEDLDGLAHSADREPGLGDDLGDGWDAAPRRVGPVLNPGADDGR